MLFIIPFGHIRSVYSGILGPYSGIFVHILPEYSTRPSIRSYSAQVAIFGQNMSRGAAVGLLLLAPEKKPNEKSCRFTRGVKRRQLTRHLAPKVRTRGACSDQAKHFDRFLRAHDLPLHPVDTPRGGGRLYCCLYQSSVRPRFVRFFSGIGRRDLNQDLELRL